MTTLIDKELFDYLDSLETDVRKKFSEGHNGDLHSLMHGQMADLIEAEKIFLRYINSNGTQPVLSISPNGLPSVASLNPDLEKMCELAKEDRSLIEVAQRYGKGIKGKNNEGQERHLYSPVSKEEWATELKNYKPEQLLSQVGFAINETEEGKFELSLMEDLFLRGYDRHSQEFPVLIREGNAQYHVVWNRLLDGIEESFYVPNTALVLQGKSIVARTKVFDDIERFYRFGRRSYKAFKGRLPSIFWKNWTPSNYSQFLSAGTSTRVNFTNNILNYLESALGKQVNLKGVRKNELEATLAFAAVPFANAPQTTPKSEDFYNTKDYKEFSKIPNVFDLISGSGTEKIGEIEYVLPHNKKYSGDYGGDYYQITLGGVNLHILGSAILNESQFEKLQIGLKHVKKR